MGIYDDFKFKVGDKVLFKNWLGHIKKGKIIGRRKGVFDTEYYAIKTLFIKDDISEFDIYGLIGHKGE